MMTLSMGTGTMVSKELFIKAEDHFSMQRALEWLKRCSNRVASYNDFHGQNVTLSRKARTNFSQTRLFYTTGFVLLLCLLTSLS